MGRTGVPLRSAAQQRGPQAQTGGAHARLGLLSAVRHAAAPTVAESEIVEMLAETGPARAGAGRSTPKCDVRHSAAGGGMIKSAWPREKLQETAE